MHSVEETNSPHPVAGTDGRYFFATKATRAQKPSVEETNPPHSIANSSGF